MTDLLATLSPIVPELLVTITAMVVIVADALMSRATARNWLPLLTVAGLLAAAWATAAGPAALAGRPATEIAVSYFGGFVQIDTFTNFFRIVFVMLAAFGTLVSPAYLVRKEIPQGEFYATMLFSTLGAMTIALATDLITLFVGIELMTIPVYVLAGIQRRDRYANEAALKYFLLGAFSSACWSMASRGSSASPERRAMSTSPQRSRARVSRTARRSSRWR